MLKPRYTLAIVTLLVLASGGGYYWYTHNPALSENGQAATDPLVTDLQTMVVDYRKVIVLLAEEETMNDSDRRQAAMVGQTLFHADQDQQALIS